MKDQIVAQTTRQNEILEEMVAERTLSLTRLNETLETKIAEINSATALNKQQASVIKNQQSQLLSAARGQAVSHLSLGISHEINNPLAIAQGNLFIIEQKLKNQNPKDNAALSATQTAHSAMLRISQIVVTLRQFTELMQPQHQDIQMAETIFNLIPGSMTSESGKKIPIQIEHATLKEQIRFDEFAVRKILDALLSNAANAVCDMENPWIIVSASEKSGMIELKVTDSGPGIPKDVAPHIFDPFYSTTKTAIHKGLGLTAAKILSESLGGTLIYDSQVQQTTFVLSLPIVIAHSQKTA